MDFFVSTSLIGIFIYNLAFTTQHHLKGFAWKKFGPLNPPKGDNYILLTLSTRSAKSFNPRNPWFRQPKNPVNRKILSILIQTKKIITGRQRAVSCARWEILRGLCVFSFAVSAWKKSNDEAQVGRPAPEIGPWIQLWENTYFTLVKLLYLYSLWIVWKRTWNTGPLFFTRAIFRTFSTDKQKR